MSRLTSKVKGAGKTALAPTVDIPAFPRRSSLAGIEIDGVNYPLQGEPPPATSRGWGDMSWFYLPSSK